MASTFLGLTIASSGLTAANAGINVTAHNISNLKTTGFSRQVVNQIATKPIRVYARYGTMGAGVTVTGIEQIRDSYYDHKYWKNQGSLGEYKQKNYYMGQIEELYFSEIKSSGFTTYYSKFTAALETLYTNPADTAKRNAVIQSAQTLCSYFNDTATNLNAYQDDTNLQISVMVDHINSCATNIASLNKQIRILELNGSTANELRDQRANVVDELSQYVGIAVTEKLTDTGSSSYSIKIGNQTLVEGQFFNTLKVVTRDGSQKRHNEDVEGLYDIVWDNGMNFTTYDEDLTGMIKGYIDIRDGNNQEAIYYPVEGTGLEYKGIPYYKVQTNLFTKEYAREFNMIQMKGQDLNGNTTIRIPFFSISTMTTEEIGKQAATLYDLYQGKITGPVSIQNADGSTTEWTQGDVKKWIEGDATEGIPGKALEYAKDQYPDVLEDNLKDASGKIKEEYLNEYLYGADYKEKAVAYAVKNGKEKSKSDCYNPDGTVKTNIINDYITDAKKDSDMAGYMVTIDYIADQMTAGNMCVNEDLILDNGLLATTTYINDGVDSQDLISEMVKLADKKFMANGNAEEFMESLVAVSSIDSDAAKAMETNYDNIASTIANQRLSISGVDEDEEAANLIKYQHAYELAAKCISVMSEIYNKLINETAV